MTTSKLLRTLAWFVLAYAFAGAMSALDLGSRVWSILDALTDDYETRDAIARLYMLAAPLLAASYAVTLGVATLVAPLGLAGRAVIRAFVRAGYRDRLDHLRDFTARRPRLTRALLATPAIAWSLFAVRVLLDRTDGWDSALPGVVLPAALVALAQFALARRGWRALLAPTLAASEARGEAATAEGFTFNAVAVTTETLATVGALAALSLAMVAAAVVLPVSTLIHHPVFRGALVGYLALALGGALLFRRASRIDVGLDGVFISGSARRRMVPFAEIDGVRTNRLSLDLTRGARVILRLQLHGEDALRRDALAERIRAAIASAEAQRREPALDFLRSASTQALGRAAGGSSSYRESSPSRDKLWELLESPAVDAGGRKAAATALAKDGSPEERARLRVAAERCADPDVRTRIAELIEEDEPAAEATPGPRAMTLRRG